VNRKTEELFVYGASGHAKVVIDIIERQGLGKIGFLVDDNPTLKESDFFGYPVIGGRSDLLRHPKVVRGIVAIGSNQARIAVASWMTANGFILETAIHPAAQVARGVTIGSGTVFMAGVVVNSDSRVGDNVIVNTGARIDHDCVVGNGVHIAPGVILCGSVSIGDATFVCAGATVLPNLSLGSNVVVGAGSVVIRDIPDGMTVAGVPAKPVNRR